MPFPESVAKTFTSAVLTSETFNSLKPKRPLYDRVNIKFIGLVDNATTGEKAEPVYAVYAGNFTGSLIGNFFQSALTDLATKGDMTDAAVLDKLKEFGWQRDQDGIIKHSDMWDCLTWTDALEATLDFAIARDRGA